MKPRGAREIDGKNGWLSPEGRWFRCAYAGHGALAYALHPHSKDPERFLELRGWQKLQVDLLESGAAPRVMGERPPNEVQAKRVRDYCLEHGFRVPAVCREVAVQRGAR